MDTRRTDPIPTPAPPRIGESLPRAIELSGGGRALATAAALLFVGSIVGGAWMTRVANTQAANRSALLSRGVTTTGLVARLWSDGDDRRRVRYQVVLDGRRYERESHVTNEQRRTLTVGAPIDVRYLPNNPAVNDLAGSTRSGIPIAVPYLLGGGLVILGLLCVAALNREQQLLSEGRLAPATVTGTKTRHSSHGGTHRSVRYEFKLLSGAMARGRAPASGKLPAIGSTIYVIYDPERPGRSATYPLSLVRPAR